MSFVLQHIDPRERHLDVEIVERKGLGHPDTICDALAERFSVALSRFYLQRFGLILHHNVDKALLRGGAARAVFGEGDVIEPIDVYLAGRAVTQAGGVAIPVEEIAVTSAREWLRENIHALDAERHVRIHCLVRPGSADLSELFGRAPRQAVPLANDTSMGIGYAPLTPVESATLELERQLNDRAFIGRHPAHGEDVKVMAVRHGKDVSLTVARAIVSPHVPSLEAYRRETRTVRDHAARAFAGLGGKVEIRVNAADSPDGSSVYLTVTGTSAECGDDGEVGRGNRANGLISPGRPMSLEALAGKNSVTHVGKLYNLVARDIAEDVVARLPAATYAECYLVSRIGAPIDQPAIAHVKVAMDCTMTPADELLVEDITHAHLRNIGRLSERVVAGAVQIY